MQPQIDLKLSYELLWYDLNLGLKNEATECYIGAARDLRVSVKGAGARAPAHVTSSSFLLT